MTNIFIGGTQWRYCARGCNRIVRADAAPVCENCQELERELRPLPARPVRGWVISTLMGAGLVMALAALAVLVLR